MIVLLSPAKSLDFESKAPFRKKSEPIFLSQAEQLNQRLRELSATELGKLMHISENLSNLNFERNQAWTMSNTKAEKQCVFSFNGDVYQGLDANTFTKPQADFAQKHLRILSGLYGVLKPMDVIQPYRLEMGSRLCVNGHKNLYQFWGSQITDALNEELNGMRSKLVVNLASNEYFKSVKKKELVGELIEPQFKDWKNGQYKMISFFAKKARGLMSRYIINNKVKKAENLKGFDYEDYKWNAELSEASNGWVFTRG